MRFKGMRILALAWVVAGAGLWGTPAQAQAPAAEPDVHVEGASADTLAVQPPASFPTAPIPRPLAVVDPAAAGVPLDLRVAREVREARIQNSALARAAADVAGFIAIPGSVVLAAALYGVGELDDRPDLRDLGLHTGQAIAVAGAVTLAGKVAVGRARPEVSPDDPYRIGFGRGISGDGYQSFPSAHTSIAFASAVVLSTDLARRHPDSAIWLVPASYGAASLAALSRLYNGHHWATDVLVGALVGSLSGWGVWTFHDLRN